MVPYMGPHDLKLSQMAPNGPKWSKFVPNGPNGSKWSHMISNSLKWELCYVSCPSFKLRINNFKKIQLNMRNTLSNINLKAWLDRHIYSWSLLIKLDHLVLAWCNHQTPHAIDETSEVIKTRKQPPLAVSPGQTP